MVVDLVTCWIQGFEIQGCRIRAMTFPNMVTPRPPLSPQSCTITARSAQGTTKPKALLPELVDPVLYWIAEFYLYRAY